MKITLKHQKKMKEFFLVEKLKKIFKNERIYILIRLTLYIYTESKKRVRSKIFHIIKQFFGNLIFNKYV